MKLGFGVLVWGAIACVAMPALAAPRRGEREVPLATVLRAAEEKLARYPRGVDAQYELARVHYLAFVYRRSRIPVHSPNVVYWKPSTLPERSWRRDRPPFAMRSEKLEPLVALDHAAKAATLFWRVLRQRPDHALSHLGLASLLEEFADSAAVYERTHLPAVLRAHDASTIRQHYARAFALSYPRDLRASHTDLQPFVSEEAALGYIRNCSSGQALSQPEAEHLARMKAAMATIQDLYRRLPSGPATARRE